MDAVLLADTPAAFDAIDAEFADGITLRDLTRIYSAPLSDYDTYPAAVNLIDDTQYLDETRSDPVLYHDFQFQLYEVENEGIGGLLPQEVLTRRLERMATGIVSVLLANDTLDAGGGDQVDHLEVRGVHYSQYAPWGESHILRGALIRIRVYFSE